MLRGVDPTATVAADATVREPVRIGPAARVGAGATVGPYAVVGARATVAAAARVERSVIWAGAQATGEVRDAIVTPAGVVPVAPD